MRKAAYISTALALVFVIVISLVLLRNYRMEAGVVAYKAGNGVLALEKLKPLAHLGDKTSQMIVGSIYAYGLGVKKDDEQAIYWFRRCGPIGTGRSDEAADPAAQLELGVAKVYASGGEGVKPDPAESAKWLRRAAEGGSKEAAALLKQQ